jgi:hypothetical protein
MLGNSWVAERLETSQERFNLMEIVIAFPSTCRFSKLTISYRHSEQNIWGFIFVCLLYCITYLVLHSPKNIRCTDCGAPDYAFSSSPLLLPSSVCLVMKWKFCRSFELMWGRRVKKHHALLVTLLWDLISIASHAPSLRTALRGALPRHMVYKHYTVQHASSLFPPCHERCFPSHFITKFVIIINSCYYL